VEVNEVTRNNTLHGLPLHQQWDREAATTDSLSLSSVLAPYGASIRPYLIANPDSGVKDWTLQFDSDQYLKVTSDRLLPIGIFLVTEADFQFQTGRLIGEQFIDHTFLGNSKNPVIKLTDSSGSGVKMTYDPSMKWVQIHTADRGGGLGSRTCLAVEPMSCPPDAFNSRIDLITMSPGAKVSHSWSIFAIEK
jgi:aldose 1-epimerase